MSHAPFPGYMVSTLPPRPGLAARVRSSAGNGPAGEGMAESLTAIPVAYRGPINYRRKTIYAIVPHYEDCMSLLVVADPVAGGKNPSRPVPV